MTLNKPNLSLY